MSSPFNINIKDLANEQCYLILEDDNNAQSILKIERAYSKVRIKTKVLKDVDASFEEMLISEAWGYDEGVYFDGEVGFEKFTHEIVATEGRLELILSYRKSIVCENKHMEKWSVDEGV